MVEQIYKNLYQDENGRYLFATDEDTRYVVDQQSYILIYMLELLLSNKNKEVIMLTPAEKANGKT